MSLIIASLYKITKNNNFKSNALIFVAIFVFFANQQRQMDYVIEKFSYAFIMPFNLFFLLILCIIIHSINYLNDEFFSKCIKNIISAGFGKANYMISVFISNAVYSFCLMFLFFFIAFIVNNSMLASNYSVTSMDLYEFCIKLLYLFLYILIYTSIVTMLFFIFKNKTMSAFIVILIYILEFIFAEKTTQSMSLGTPFSNLMKICTLTLPQIETFINNLAVVLIPVTIIAMSIIITSVVFAKRDIDFYT